MKDERIFIRVTKMEKEMLRKIAQSKNVSMSELLLNSVLRKEGKENE